MGAPVLSIPLSELINKSFSTGIFPDNFKHAIVTPIFKSGSTMSPSNYRPIPVLPTISEVVERVVYDHLYSFLQSNMLLSNCQSGFRLRHSTMTALTKFHNDILSGFNVGKATGSVMLDLSKALIRLIIKFCYINLPYTE